MKNIIILIVCIFSLSTFASISIVSDLDDTIKITNSGDEVDGAINAAFRSDVFTGITEFFSGAKLYTNELHVLSASPLILRGKIISTLKKRKIHFDSLTLKNALAGETKLEYKVKEMKKLIEKSSDDFILIGDDVGQDPEAYAEIQRLYPERVLAIYIHMVKNRSIPSGIKYWTSFDLFLREFMTGRMTPGWVEQGLQTMMNEEKFLFIIPDFAHCPRTRNHWEWQTSSMYSAEAFVLTQKILDNCQLRNSGILVSH